MDTPVIQRNLASVRAYYISAEADAMRRFRGAQDWMDACQYQSEYAREQAYRRLVDAEADAIRATTERRAFEKRHPNCAAVTS